MRRSPYFPLGLAALVALVPGVIVLQVLPRLVAPEAGAGDGVVLGVMGTILPLFGALLSGLVMRGLTDPDPKVAVVAGVASQLPALPGFLERLSVTLGLGLSEDAAVLTMKFLSYVVIGGTLADLAANYGREDGNVFPGANSRRWLVQVACATIFLLTALYTLNNPAVPLSFPLFAALAALCLSFYSMVGRRYWRRNAGLSLLVASVGVGIMTVAVLISVSLPTA